MQKTLYQILIKVYSTETSNISSKYMKLGKLFVMKQNIIIYKTVVLSGTYGAGSN